MVEGCSRFEPVSAVREKLLLQQAALVCTASCLPALSPQGEQVYGTPQPTIIRPLSSAAADYIQDLSFLGEEDEEEAAPSRRKKRGKGDGAR